MKFTSMILNDTKDHKQEEVSLFATNAHNKVSINMRTLDHLAKINQRLDKPEQERMESLDYIEFKPMHSKQERMKSLDFNES